MSGATCRCGATVVQCKTPEGRSIAVDVSASPRGTYLLQRTEQRDGEVIYAVDHRAGFASVEAAVRRGAPLHSRHSCEARAEASP